MGVKGLTTFSNKIFEEFASEKERLLKKKIQELENIKDDSQEVQKVLADLKKELLINKEKQDEKCFSFDINMGLFKALSEENDLKNVYFPKINKKNKITLIIDANSFFFYFASKINWLSCDYSKFIELLKFYVRIFLSIKDIKNIIFVFDGIEPFNKINSGTSLKRTKSKDKRIFNKIRHNLLYNNIRKSIDDKIVAHNPFYPPPLCTLIYMVELRKISKNLKEYGFPVNFKVVQADYEADVIVAKYARKLNGFIIGNDSDYLIYESPGYIPLDSISFPDIKKMDYSSNKKLKIQATLWKNKSLCYILGFSSIYMPIFATLCGNDYIDSFKIPTDFLKEYAKTAINNYILDKIENENFNIKTILRNINKEVNIFNDKDSLKEALEDFPQLKNKIDRITKSKEYKIKNKNNIINIKDEDLYNIGMVLHKKNYLKILIEYLKKKITQSEKDIFSGNVKNIPQEREKNKELLIQTVLLKISKDKNEPYEYYQKVFNLVKVYLSNEKFIEIHHFSEYINEYNVGKIKDYFSKGMFYGKSLKVLKYKTFHCSPYLDNVFNESCWEITNTLRKEFYSILFSIYSKNNNNNESIIIEEYKRKRIELGEKELQEIEENDDDERLNNIYIVVETENKNQNEISLPRRRVLKYYINKYINEDIKINLRIIPDSEKEKFNLYKTIFYSQNIKMNSIRKKYIPIATSLRYFIIEIYKMNPNNALTAREISALLASIVLSMSNLFGNHNSIYDSTLKSINRSKPLPKVKVPKMSLSTIHRFSQFQNIIFLNIFLLSALSLLDSSYIVNKNNVLYYFHEYCWGYGFYRFLEYFKTVDYLQNEKGENVGPFNSNYLNTEYKNIFNAITEDIQNKIIDDINKPFLKFYYSPNTTDNKNIIN